MKSLVLPLTFATSALAAALLSGQAMALTLLTEQNLPFNGSVEGKSDGRPVGLSVEVLTEAARRAGLSPTISVQPWADAYLRAQVDKETCLFSTARLENRERLFRWVGPVANNRWVIFAPEEFKPVIKTITDMRRYRIGAVASDAKAEYLKGKGVAPFIEDDDDSRHPARLFLPRDHPQRIDLWVAGEMTGRQLAARAKVPAIKVVFMLREEPLWLACSPRTSKDTLTRLQGAIDAMVRDGTLKSISARFQNP